ncbi:hypothetical protein [Actinomadura fibrosa]|uniref:Uncharacterized protein n=1 Tax=Actinomadura fibrosa TaxID=111802 RepID=A0ABW2XBS5_9ACTN|nr:hypothetical protein [Actinomadura fibrosa]
MSVDYRSTEWLLAGLGRVGLLASLASCDAGGVIDIVRITSDISGAAVMIGKGGGCASGDERLR